MQLLFNDLSLEGQFRNISAFEKAVDQLMLMRRLALAHDRELYCNRNVCNSEVIPGIKFLQAINRFRNTNKHKGLLNWVTKLGPFWEEGQEYPMAKLWCNGKEISDSAVGEAARNIERGSVAAVISITPSPWCFSPLKVAKKSNMEGETVEVQNFWEENVLDSTLRQMAPPLSSWEDLERIVRKEFSWVVFTADAFKPLQWTPFAPGAAQHLLQRMQVLENVKVLVDERGQRTKEGKRIYQEYFIGRNAWFSDSSATEKRRFREDLKFRHPKRGKKPLFCPWHGKIKMHQLRFHFTWPVKSNERVYVVYVGPKITKQ